ncbi:MAG: CHAD domain-containing protein [Chloroflexota bacterium]
MAYAWVWGESVPDGIRRIIREQAEDALAQLQVTGDERDTAIHSARKAFKRIRAALRMVRKEIGDDVFSEQNALYRDIARELSPVRDAYMVIQTLDSVSNQIEDDAITKATSSLRDKLDDNYQKVRQDFWQTDTVVTVSQRLSDAMTHIDTLPIQHNGFKAFKKSIKQVYKRGQKQMIVAYTSVPQPEPFHEWRKRVKYLRYHMEILQSIHSEITPLHTKFDELSEVLGTVNDLAVLHERLSNYPATKFGAGRHLLAILDYQRGRLEKSIHDDGETLYAMSPNAFVKQINEWWANPIPSPA